MDTMELRRQRANIWEQMKALHEKAEAEKRGLTAEESEQWARMETDLDQLRARIDREERLGRERAELDRSLGALAGKPDPEGRADQPDQEYRRAFGAWLRGGVEGLEPEQRQVLRTGYREMPVEARAMSTIVGATGGFTVPDEATRPITEAMTSVGAIREVAEVITTDTGADMPWPTADNTSRKGRRIGENKAATAATDPAFGQKVLRSYIYTSDIIQVPFALLQDSGLDIESMVLRWLGEANGRGFSEEATATGTGNNMPEALVLQATSAGTTASASAVTYDELIDLAYSVKEVYRRNARWMFADSVIPVLRKIKDTTNMPIWQPGMQAGEPDRLLNFPYTINDDMPAMTASKRAIAFGDLRAYKVRDVRGQQVLRLTERYAEYGQVGFLLFSRHDGILVDAGTHPVKVLTQHA